MMNGFFRIAVVFIATAFGASSLAEEPADKAPPVQLLVPAYFYPSGNGAKEWDKLLAAADRAAIVAIVNPASGPGRRVDPNYTTVLEKGAKAKRLTLIGYVSTSYAKRPLEEVKADVDQWLKFYPGIQGIFFDEQPSDAEQVDYYATLYKHVRETHKLQLVITNPGTICAEVYASKPAADAVCLFEGPQPFDTAKLPGWRTKYDAHRAAVLSYQIDAVESMQRLIASAAERHLGYCYITDDSGNNPWDRLPTYWDEEVKAAEWPTGSSTRHTSQSLRTSHKPDTADGPSSAAAGAIDATHLERQSCPLCLLERMVRLGILNALFLTPVLVLRAIPPSAHGEDDANDRSGDSRHKRDEDRTRPNALPIE